MYELVKKNSYRREISEQNMRFAPHYEQYLRAAELLGIDDPIPPHIIHLREEKDGEVEYPVIARVATCPDGIVRTQITTAAVDLFSKINKGILAVFLHELSHFKNKDMKMILLSKWVPLVFNVALSVFILWKIGVMDFVFNTDGFTFYPMAQASYEAESRKDAVAATAAVTKIKEMGGAPPLGLVERAEYKASSANPLWFGFNAVVNAGTAYVYTIVVSVRLFFVMFIPVLISRIIANAVMLGVARPQEFRADVEAARIVGTDAYIKVLETLNDGSVMNKLTKFFWDTHPPTSARIEHLEMLREAGILTKNGVI